MTTNITRPSRFNLLLLLLASLATLGTLKPDYKSGLSSEYTGWPRGESRQRMTATLAPIGNRISLFNYPGELHLELSIKHIQDIQAPSALWTLTAEVNGETIALGGGFPDFGGDLGREDNGDIIGDAIVRIGQLCPNEQAQVEGCLPCLDGCILTIDADRCEFVGDSIKSSEVRIVRSDGTRFELRCEDDEDPQPCSELNDWLTVSTESLTTSLCLNGGN